MLLRNLLVILNVFLFPYCASPADVKIKCILSAAFIIDILLSSTNFFIDSLIFPELWPSLARMKSDNSFSELIFIPSGAETT